MITCSWLTITGLSVPELKDSPLHLSWSEAFAEPVLPLPVVKINQIYTIAAAV